MNDRTLPEGIYWERCKCGLVRISADRISVNGGRTGWGCPRCNLERAEAAERRIGQRTTGDPDLERAVSYPAEPRDDSDRLKPCPFCGGESEIAAAAEAGPGAYVVQCTEQRCLASSRIIYACGDDPGPLLLEAWNRRSANQPQLPLQRDTL